MNSLLSLHPSALLSPRETKCLKSLLVERYQPLLPGHADLLELALNEAESLAWETSFPRLVFPALAEEKLESLHGWARRQRALCESTRPTALAA